MQKLEAKVHKILTTTHRTATTTDKTVTTTQKWVQHQLDARAVIRGGTTSACHPHVFNTHIPNFDLRNVCVKDMRMSYLLWAVIAVGLK